MKASILGLIISGVVGLLSGAVGSLVAPWIHWGIEKRRDKRAHRRELINSWRVVLQSKAFDRRAILECPTYGILREELTEDARKQIERSSSNLILDNDSPISNPDKRVLLNEIARIEKKWRLV